MCKNGNNNDHCPLRLQVGNILKILGANPFDKSVHQTIDDFRYGSVMIMADQDFDGSHIKGLLINMFQSYFPHLLRDEGHTFLKEFITPIVKATAKKAEGAGGEPEGKEFFSMITYEAWVKEQEAAGTLKNWTFKYYKGLGTSTSKEAKVYFSHLEKHKVDFEYSDQTGRAVGGGGGDMLGGLNDIAELLGEERAGRGGAAASSSAAAGRPAGGAAASSSAAAVPPAGSAGAGARVFEDDDLIDMAFHPARADDRKKWMNASLGEALDTSSGKITFKQFINQELVEFSKYDLRRAVPSMVDGQKPSQRKIIFACFLRRLTSDLKVAQLSGYVSEKASYHHGETSLQGAIVQLAQVGSCETSLQGAIVQLAQVG